MMVPQPTAQYGQVDRVSLARAIFSVRSCAYAGCRSNPKTAAAAPPTAVYLRNSRREGFIGDLNRKERRLASRGVPFLERWSQSVKPVFRVRAEATRSKCQPCQRCQPADAGVAVRGSSVSMPAAV